MIEVRDVRANLAAVFKAGGVNGRGSIWRLELPEVQWIIHLDTLPPGYRLGIDVGATMQEDPPARPTDCPILIHVENMPLGDQPLLVHALHLDADMPDAERMHSLTQAAQALADYLQRHGTLSSLREAYAAGDLRSAFISADFRAILERSDPG